MSVRSNYFCDDCIVDCHCVVPTHTNIATLFVADFFTKQNCMTP